MKNYQIIKQLQKLNKGSWFCIEYESDQDWLDRYLKAQYRNLVNITKISMQSLRTGVDPNNIKKNIERKLAIDYIPSNRTSHYTTKDHVIGKNKTKDVYYLLGVLNGIPKNTYKITYNGITQIITGKELQELGFLRDSYWKTRDPKTDYGYRTLKIQNIRKIWNRNGIIYKRED